MRLLVHSWLSMVVMALAQEQLSSVSEAESAKRALQNECDDCDDAALELLHLRAGKTATGGADSTETETGTAESADDSRWKIFGINICFGCGTCCNLNNDALCCSADSQCSFVNGSAACEAPALGRDIDIGGTYGSITTGDVTIGTPHGKHGKCGGCRNCCRSHARKGGQDSYQEVCCPSDTTCQYEGNKVSCVHGSRGGGAGGGDIHIGGHYGSVHTGNLTIG
ncbi:unnamed protein product [Durusdinium trenchii]|uniref:Uncharacterized protein n=1 Tax=Durusdinium trenchii TaxID=1381693 RepID=A0ABP0KUU5_9DINO